MFINENRFFAFHFDNFIAFMFKKFTDLAFFFIRRRAQVLFLNIDIFTMRSCKNCSKSSISCRVTKDFEKCTKCFRLDRLCDLTLLNIARWRRLKNKRQSLKKEFKESYAKQQRLFCQIDYLKKKQRTIMKNELQIIFELKKKKFIIFNFLLNFILLIDVFLETLVLFNDWKNWIVVFFDFEILATFVDNSQNSWMIFTCFLK